MKSLKIQYVQSNFPLSFYTVSDMIRPCKITLYDAAHQRILGHSLMTKSCFFHRSKVRYKPHILIIPKLICCNTTLTSLKNRANHEQYSYLWNKKFDDIWWNMDCDIWRPQYRMANYVCIFDLVSQLWRNWWLQFIAAIICFTWVVYWSNCLMARYSTQARLARYSSKYEI